MKNASGIAAVLAVLLALWLAEPPAGLFSDNDAYWKVKIVAGSILLGLVGQGLVTGALFACKWWLDWDFRFLILRRNSARYGYGHKISVMATCGKYGQVVSLRDPTLDQTDEGYGERRESSMGAWFQIFSEIEHTIRPVTFLHSWQRQVLLELEVTDFAVFDWIEEITDWMRWELRNAGERLPAHRILIIHSPENQAAVNEFLASCDGLFAARPLCLVAPRGRDDEFIWADHREFDRAFENSLYDALSKLVAEPRRAHARVQAGVWPYPRPHDIPDEAVASP